MERILFVCRDEICHEICESGIVVEGTDNSAFHIGRGVQHILHLLRFDSFAEYHHLLIATVEEGDVSIGQKIAHITAAIHSFAVREFDEIPLFRRSAEITG